MAGRKELGIIKSNVTIDRRSIYPGRSVWKVYHIYGCVDNVYIKNTICYLCDEIIQYKDGRTFYAHDNTICGNCYINLNKKYSK